MLIFPNRLARAWLCPLALSAVLQTGCVTGAADPPRSAVPGGPAPTAIVESRATAAPPSPATGGFAARTFPADPGAALEVQNEVDGGRQPWRLDPIQVARSTLDGAGVDSARARFIQTEQSNEPSTGRHRTIVRATTSEAAYEVELLQPVRQDATGIWVATALRRA